MNVYADYAATSPMRGAARDAMMEALEAFGNPSSIHAAGRLAAMKMESARKEVAELLNCRPSEIFFTSGGTEADNWAIRAATGRSGRVVASAFEHHAILHTLEALERAGVRHTLVNPEPDGIMDPDNVAAATDPATDLVTVMAANNEIGTVQPIGEIVEAVRHRTGKDPIIHTDAVQAVGHIPVDVQKLGVDMLSLSAHKFGGPRGVGVLYANERVRLAPFMYGGGQERGRRPGTENVPAIVAMAAAMRQACEGLDHATEWVTRLHNRLYQKIMDIPGARINGSMDQRLPGNINCRFDGVEGEALVILLDLVGVCVSAGSACTSGSGEPSHVLTAIGQSSREAYGALRISLGEKNTPEEVDYIAKKLAEAVHLTRSSR